jgi:hypothetical protein
MSALEVLQHCPSQRRTLLAAIGTFDLESSNYLTFNLDDHQPRLSHHLTFQSDVVVHNQKIHRTILDEGASTCVMSLACWKGLKSPALNKSATMLRAFDGRVFHPHGLYIYGMTEMFVLHQKVCKRAKYWVHAPIQRCLTRHTKT